MAKREPEEFPRSRRNEIRDRLRKEGRWSKQAEQFKQDTFEELHRDNISGRRAQNIVWREILRRYPPLPEKPEEEDDEYPEVTEEDSAAIEEMLDKFDSVDLANHIRWAHAQFGNKNATRDQEPGPGAYDLLLFARKYETQFRLQLLPKALAKDSGAEGDIVKREKARLEDIEEMLERLAEREDEDE